MAEPTNRIVITYIGRRMCNDGTLGHYYLTEEKKRLGFNKKLGSASVGSLLEVGYDEAAAQVKGPYDYKGRSTSTELTDWVNQDRASQLQLETDRMKKKESTTEYDSNIDSLKDQYRKLPPAQRLAFLVRIQRDISSQR